VLSATFYVAAIIFCYTKNIYKICNCKPHPESKFPDEYIDVIFIQIYQNLKKLFKKYKGVPILWNTVYSCSSSCKSSPCLVSLLPGWS